MSNAERAVEIWGRTRRRRPPLLCRWLRQPGVWEPHTGRANLVGLWTWLSPILVGSIQAANGSPWLPGKTDFKRFIWGSKGFGKWRKAFNAGRPLFSTINSLCRPSRPSTLCADLAKSFHFPARGSSWVSRVSVHSKSLCCTCDEPSTPSRCQPLSILYLIFIP